MKNENPTQNRIAHLLERMTLFEKRILICRLCYLVGKRKIALLLKKLPNLILTPDGIHVDRRIQTHPFRAVERRFVNILRYKLYIWLYGSDDTDPTAS